MKTEGYLYLSQWKGDDKPELVFDTDPDIKSNQYFARRLIGPYTLEADIDSTDLRAEMVAGLRARERELRAEFEKSVTDIQRRINELLAIEG